VAAPTIVGTAVSSAGGTSATAVIPAATQTGDLILVFAGNGGADTNPTVSDNSGDGIGYTNFVDPASFRLNGYRKAATASSAGATVTSSGNTSTSAVIILVLRGWNTGVAGGVDAQATSVNASTDESSVGITTSVVDTLIIFVIFNYTNDIQDSTSYSTTDPGALTERAEASSTTGTDCAMNLATATKASIGATGNFTWAQTDGATHTIQLAIGPATLTHYTLPGDAAAFTLSGQDVAVKYGRRVSADAGAFVLSGQDVGLSFVRKVAADTGSFILTGQDVGLRAIRTMPADAGAFVLTGIDVALSKGRTLAVDAGSFILTGQDVSLFYGRRVAAEAGSFLLTGQDVILARSRLFVVDPGAFVLSGQDVSLKYGRTTVAETGVFLLSGQDVGVLATRRLVADTGAFVLTGRDVALSKGRTLAIDAGSFVLTGQDVNFLRGLRLTAGTGAFVLSGQVVELFYFETPPTPVAETIDVGGGRYAPAIPPQIFHEDTRLLLEYIERELQEVARSMSSFKELQLMKLYAAPERPREGMTVVADGTTWNPGAGAGVYSYVGGAWTKL
jgi:hypothetical protein